MTSCQIYHVGHLQAPRQVLIPSYPPTMAQPIPSELYNRIRDVESQSSALESSSIGSLWTDIYGILARHDAHKNFGIGLLHRHLDLPSEHIMVHETDEHGHDVCRPEIFGARSVYPASYQLQDDCIMAYEFSSTPTRIPPSALLHDLAAFLRASHLQELVALSHIHTWDCAWLEQMTDDLKGTYSISAPLEFPSSQHGYIATEWGFIVSEGGVHTVELKGCIKQDNGGHSRT